MHPGSLDDSNDDRWPLAFRAAVAMAGGAAAGWWVLDRAAIARESETLIEVGSWDASQWMVVVAVAGCVVGAIAAVLVHGRNARDLCVLVASAGAGMLMAIHGATEPGTFDGADGGPVTVIGVVASAPTVDDGGGDRLARFSVQNASQAFELDLTGIECDGAVRPADGSVLVRVAGLAPLPARGTVVRARGWFNPSHRTRNPGIRDRPGGGTVSVPGSQLVVAVERGPLDRLLVPLRGVANDSLLRAMPESASAETTALVAAMTTGIRLPGLSVPSAEFRAAGMSHVLAISGFNVAVLVTACAGVAGVLGIQARGRAMVAIVVAGAFLAVTEPETSVLRAGLGAGLAAIASLRGGRARGLGTLGVVAILTMVTDVDAIAGAGFQLSYGVVVALLVVSPRVQSRWQRRAEEWSTYPRLPVWVRSEFLQLVRAAAVESIVAALVAWTVSTPIAAWHAGCMNGWAAPLSVVTMPAAAIATIGGVAAMSTVDVVPPLGHACGVVSAWCASALEWTAHAASHAPGGTWCIGRMDAWWVVASLVACVTAWIAASGAVRMVGWIVAVIMMVGAWWGPLRPCAFPPGVGEVTVESIAVGNGACILVRSVDTTILFDAGSMSDPNAGSRRIVPVLAALGVRSIDAVVLGSRSLSECSAVPEVIVAFPVRRVITDPRCMAGVVNSRSGASAELRAAITERGIELDTVHDGDIRQIGSLCIRAVLPPPDRNAKHDPGGMVVDVRGAWWPDAAWSIRLHGKHSTQERARSMDADAPRIVVPPPADTALRITARADGTFRSQHWTLAGWR